MTDAKSRARWKVVGRWRQCWFWRDCVTPASQSKSLLRLAWLQSSMVSSDGMLAGIFFLLRHFEVEEGVNQTSLGSPGSVQNRQSKRSAPGAELNHIKMR